jgi:hypothetical protein
MILKTRWKYARDLASHTAYVSGNAIQFRGTSEPGLFFRTHEPTFRPGSLHQRFANWHASFLVGECSWALSSAGIRQVAMRMAIRFTFASNLSGRCSDARTGSASKNASSGVHKDVTHRAAALFHNPANNFRGTKPNPNSYPLRGRAQFLR